MAYSDIVRRGELERTPEEQAAVAQGASARALAALAISGLLSAAIYVAMFSLPFGLTRLQAYTHLDLERLQIFGHHVQWPLLLALLAAGALYWLAWQAARQAHGVVAWLVVIAGALLSAAAFLPMYPIGSTDIFDYIMHGRMLGIYHANPFVQIAAQFPQDLFYYYSGWPTTPSAYGALWEILAGAVARLAGSTFIRNVIAFKLIEVVFLAASASAVAAILHRAAPERALAGVLLLTWNPIVLYETVGNGHNDIVMVFCILAAVLAILYRHYTLGILALVAGTLIKFIPVLMLPAAGLIALRDLPNWRSRLRFVLVTAVLAGILVLVSYGPFWHGPQTLGIDRRSLLFTSSLPATVLWLIQPHVHMPLDQLMKLISRVAAVATALFALWEGVRAWRDRSWLSFTRSAFNISVFYLLCAVMWLWPWYSLWPLALAVILPPGGSLLLAQVMAFGFSDRPFFYAYLVMKKPFLPTPAWREIRLGASMLAPAWVTLVGAFLVAAAARIRRLATRPAAPAGE